MQSMYIADTGIPMLAFEIGPALVLFIPVVLLESLITWPIVRQPIRRVVSNVATANAVSTFAGIPMAWIFMVIVEFMMVGGGANRDYKTPWEAFRSLVFGSAWLPPPDNNHEFEFFISAATLVLLAPYFFTSVFIERWAVRRRWRGVSPGRVTTANWVSNIASYGLLYAWALYHFRHVGN